MPVIADVRAAKPLLRRSKMRETSTYGAIYTGIMELNFCGADFNPNISSLAWELLISK